MRLKSQQYSAKTVRMQKTVYKLIYEHAIYTHLRQKKQKSSVDKLIDYVQSELDT